MVLSKGMDEYNIYPTSYSEIVVVDVNVFQT